MPIKRVTFEAPPVKPKARKSSKAQRRANRKALAAKLSANGKKPKVGSIHVADEKLDFAQLIQRSVDVMQELHRLESCNKLSARAFIADALKLCGKTVEELRAANARLLSMPGTDRTRQFIRVFGKELASARYPCLPIARLSKVLRIHGDTDLPTELGIVGMSISDAIALAVLHSTEAFPEDYGTVSDLAAHHQKVADHRERLQKLYALMKDKISASDFLMESRSLSDAERRSGHVVVRLRRHPQIHCALENWPEMLTRAELRAQFHGPDTAPEPEPAPQSGPMDPAAKAQLLRDAVRSVVIPMQSAM